MTRVRENGTLVARRIRVPGGAAADWERLAGALRGAEDVIGIDVAPPYLALRYRVPGFGVDALERAAAALDLDLGLPRWRRAWWRYTETVLARNAGHDASWSALIRDIYMSRYRHRRHGRRDDRRQHWQQYRRREARG